MAMDGNVRSEGFINDIGSAIVTGVDYVFASGTEAVLKQINLQAPGVTAGTEVTFYDGLAASGTPLTGSIPLLAQPNGGWGFDHTFGQREGLMITTGSLGIAVYCNVQASKKLYAFLEYQY